MATEPEPPTGPKRVLGVPYDWRRPTVARVKSRAWNPDDRRLFTPKSFGAGWTINAYWLAHPVRRFKRPSP